jgi:hypothetical protein
LGYYSLALKDYNGVLQKIADVNSLSTAFHFGVLLAQQPTNVSKKETTAGVMRISISFAKLVMDTVISAPFINIVLSNQIQIEMLTNDDVYLFYYF